MKPLPAELNIKKDGKPFLCLENICNTVERTWKKPLLQHFTEHGLDHSESVIQILGKLIKGQSGFGLNDEERFVLVAAAYLHDIGMQLPVYAGLKKKSNYSSKEKKKIRDKHNEASYKAIIKSVKKNPTFYIDWKEECERFAELVAKVSKYHRQLNLNDNELKNTSIHGKTIRLRLLAALLKLADELDQDYKRINSNELKRVDILPESKFYWWSHKFVNSVDIQKGKIELYLIFPEGEKDKRILDAFEQNLYEKSNKQLNEVYDILDASGLRLYPIVNIADKKPSNLDGLEISDDLRMYVMENFVITEGKIQELNRRGGATFYLDGILYSDDREVVESIKKIISLMTEYKYKEAVKEIRNFQKRELVTGPKDKMIFLLNAGNCLFLTGNLDEAKRNYEEVINISSRKEMQDRYGNEMRQAKAGVLGNIGLVYFDKGDLAETLKHHKEALAIDKEIGNRQGEANQLGNIGLVYYRKGNLGEALKYHKEALDIHRAIGNCQGEANQLGNIGLVYFEKADHENAVKFSEKALDIFEKIGAKIQYKIVLNNIINICEKASV